MKKHPALVRYTIDVEHNLSILEGSEDGGDSPVVEGFTVEHALELALVDLKYAKRDVQILEHQASQPKVEPVPTFNGTSTFNKIAAIKAFRNKMGTDLRAAKSVVDFVMHYGGHIQPGSDLEIDRLALAGLNSWAHDACAEAFTGHPVECICDKCRVL